MWVSIRQYTVQSLWVCVSVYLCIVCHIFAWACVKCFRLLKGSTNSIWVYRVRWRAWHGLACSRFSLFVRLILCAQMMYHILNLIQAIVRGHYFAFNVYRDGIIIVNFQTKEWRIKKTKNLLFLTSNCKNKRKKRTNTEKYKWENAIACQRVWPILVAQQRDYDCAEKMHFLFRLFLSFPDQNIVKKAFMIVVCRQINSIHIFKTQLKMETIGNKDNEKHERESEM